MSVSLSVYSERQEAIEQARERILSEGLQPPPPKPKSSHFDSNCITPGTEFMARLAICLEYYVHDRLNTNPAWQGIKVREGERERERGRERGREGEWEGGREGHMSGVLCA